MKYMTKAILLSVFTLLITPFSFGATLRSTTQNQMVQAFVNKTASSIGTEQLDGRTIVNPFSMFISSNGTISAKMAEKPKNEPQEDTGRYMIAKDGTFYVQWNHWFQAKRLCAHVFNTQNAYIFIGCDNTFQSVFMKNAISPGKQF